MYYVVETQQEVDVSLGSISIVRSAYVIGSEDDIEAWAEDKFGPHRMEQRSFYKLHGDVTALVASNDLKSAVSHAEEEMGLDVEEVKKLDTVSESEAQRVQLDSAKNPTCDFVCLV